MNVEHQRIILKRSTTASEAAEIAPSTDHTDGTWDKKDIYIGEAFVNVVDDKIYLRTNNGIKRISLTDDYGVIYRKRVTLSSAQVLALNTTPIVAIATPGAGKAIQLISVAGKYSFNTIAYAGAGLITIRYTSGGGNVTQFNNSFLTDVVSRLQSGSFISNYDLGENTSLELFCTVADPTLGNGTYEFDILYRIENTSV